MTGQPGAATLLESELALGVFEALFVRLYELSGPALPLQQIMHWVRRFQVDCPAVDHERTLVFGGYFYNFSSVAPSADAIAEARARARALGAAQLLVPTVRRTSDRAALRDAGFLALPWFIEAIVDLRDGVDAALAERLSLHQRKELARLVRRAEETYDLVFLEGEEALRDPAAMREVARLHGMNIEKYGHARNFYDEGTLAAIAASALGPHLLLCLRRERATGEAVQASVNFIDRTRGQLFQMVQGIDRARVPGGQNLYIAETLQMYRLAERAGLREVHLGRGGHPAKRKLGANRFRLLENWVYAPAAARAELTTLRAAAVQALGLDDDEARAAGDFTLE
ncbi:MULTISPECIES: hypothetical protein [Sorangium]|uniref:BioF2-like acetyltransferase domain-containing protein n=1 Tax=Sorangium atrum TaxID=2995308 RepID=A0ABT5BWT0_9BACT|nr:hypothetical protein [Sorangium aterium]MDC0677421.1 hypothetical protein [Sorangium aterium]